MTNMANRDETEKNGVSAQAGASRPVTGGEGTVSVRKPRNPYLVFFWGALLMAAVCFWLGTERLEIQRPARADAYFITGLLGILGAAMAWSLGASHERARRSQQSLQESLDGLQESMKDMPRSLMEESVRVAAREAESRRADQERQARELRTALEQGINAGFAPMAPAIAGRIEESLKGMSDALRSDREERAASLKATAETVASLQAAQAEWSKASSALLEKLREQGTALHNDLSARDASARAAWDQSAAAAHAAWEANTASAHAAWETTAASAKAAWEELVAAARASWERAAESSTAGVQAALGAQMEKVTGLVETLSARWDETLGAQRESLTGEWREVLAESREQLEQAAAQAREYLAQSAEALGAAVTEASAAVQATTAAAAAAVRSASEEAAAALSSASTEASALVQRVSGEADTRLEATSGQAEEWLRSLSSAAGAISEALEAMRRTGEETAVQQAAGQAEWRATVEMFHQGMGGVLDRLQSLGSYTEGQAALLERMEEVIRSFEERSAELIEDTALKAQESLLEALDQAGARDTEKA